MLHLILGGARSGKSRYAEKLALALWQQANVECHYVATAKGLDKEMQARIAQHKQDRANSPISWLTHETHANLANTLTNIAAPNRLILVDCLTLWLTNELTTNEQTIEVFEQQKHALLKVLEQLPGNIFLVSNEVGSGIVPLGQLTRQFVDQAGWLNQSIANIADKVTLVVAGLPLNLKG